MALMAAMSDSATFYLEDRLRRDQPEVLLTRVFAPKADQQAISAQFVLLDEISQLVQIRETGVAMTKMAWWFEEWKRLKAGEPTHPVTKTLAESANSANTEIPRLDGMLSVVASMIQGQSPGDLSELSSWLVDFCGPLAALEPTASSDHAVADSWQQIVLLKWISTLPRLAELGRAPWPLELSAQTQIRRAQLNQPELQRRAVEALWSAVAGTSAATPIRQSGHAGIYLSVVRTTLLARALGQPSAGRWQTLWTAWRARRRC